MATLRFGQVYFQGIFAGYLRQEPGDRMLFSYDPSYLEGSYPAISYTLPLQTEPYISSMGLHPFFDNLVSEGWLEAAQSRFLNSRQASRFELLLAFGLDCIGAVSIIDPEPAHLSDHLLNPQDAKEWAILASRASLSGVQAKMALIEKEGLFYPTKANELSTHIAKFSSPTHPDLIDLEYLSTQILHALLPNDPVVQIKIGAIQGFSEPALIVKRFDREQGQRLHFEEFNQLLNHSAHQKYDADYKDLAHFIQQHPQCLSTEIYRLFLRILAGFLLGNTDMHLKNFGLLYTPTGLRLTPSYDQVSAILYRYKQIALGIAGAHNLELTKLKPSHILKLGQDFNLSSEVILMAIQHLQKHIPVLQETLMQEPQGSLELKNKLITQVTKRWNGTFALTGQLLSKKQ